jgi:CPA2 family monovalent cation:H+ antiporter-2
MRLPLRAAFGADREVVPIAALAFCGVCATASGLLGLSTAFGGFLAGLVVGNSSERQIVLRGTRPIQSVLLVVFFLSVGLLIDIKFFFDNLGTLLVVFILATVAKGLINVVALRVSGQSWEQSVIVGVTLGQIGEFAFVIASVGLTVGAINADGYKIAVAVIALSLMLGPVWVALERRLRAAEDLGGRLASGEQNVRNKLKNLIILFRNKTPGLSNKVIDYILNVVENIKAKLIGLYSKIKP